jgi:hypothetical protein
MAMMTSQELRTCLADLGLDDLEAAELLGVSDRTVRRWVDGEEVPGPVEQALRAWRRLHQRGLAWRPDSVSILDDDQQQIAAHRQHAIALDEILSRVQARGGPRLPWIVDREGCRATCGKMEVSFYKLANGGFSPAQYKRKDTYPDVQRDGEFIDDAFFYIAKAMTKEADKPVTLVYMEGPGFVGSDGKFGSIYNEEFPSNESAIERACELTKKPDVHSLAIREGTKNSSGEFLWNDPELRKECERRNNAKPRQGLLRRRRA